MVATPSGSAQHGAVMSHEGPEPSDWAGLAEVYTMHSFAPFSNLNFFVKNRQNFFAIELVNIH